MHLLSVDWDYFVPSIDHEFLPGSGGRVPYASSGGEIFPDHMLDALWDSRAAMIQAHGLPLPGTSGEEAGFWDRFSLDASATLFYADSHAQAAHAAIRSGISKIWSYDAHHDCGYEGALEDVDRLGWVGCANWMCYYFLRGADLHVRYPAWRSDALERELPPLCPVERRLDDGMAPAVTFDVIFACRSSAWTPPWLDGMFEGLIAAAPVRRRVCLDPFWRRREGDAAWIAHLQDEMEAARA
jgi:hypothetical protein